MRSVSASIAASLATPSAKVFTALPSISLIQSSGSSPRWPRGCSA